PVVLGPVGGTAALGTLTIVSSAGTTFGAVNSTGALTTAPTHTGSLTFTGLVSVGSADLTGSALDIQNVFTTPGLGPSNSITIVTDSFSLPGSINTGLADTTIVPLTAGTPIGLGTGAGALLLTDAEVDGIVAGTIFVGDAGAGTILVDNLTLGSKNLHLESGGTINDTDDIGTAVVTTGHLSLVAPGGIGNLNGPEGFSFDAGTFDFSAGPDADIVLTHANSAGVNIVFGAVTGGLGNIGFFLTNGDLLLDTVNTGGNVTLGATNGGILDNNADTPGDNITANSASLSAATGIGLLGNRLEINVNALTAATTGAAPGSGIFIGDAASISLNNVTAVNGDIDVQAGMNIDVNAPMSTSLAGNIILSANENVTFAAAGDLSAAGDIFVTADFDGNGTGTITMSPGATFTTFASDVFLSAAGDILLDTINITGGLFANSLLGSIENSGVMNIGAGLTFGAATGVVVNGNITTQSAVLINTGLAFVVNPGATINTNNTALLASLESFNLGGTINTGSEVLAITAANDLNLTGVDVQGILADQVVIVSSGNISLDNVTSAQSSGIVNGLRLDAGGDVLLANNPVALNALSITANGNAVVNVDVVTATGDFAALADNDGDNLGDFSLAANTLISSAGVISIQGANVMNDGTLTSAGAATVISSGTIALNAMNISGNLIADSSLGSIISNGLLTVGGGLTLVASNDITVLGDITSAGQTAFDAGTGTFLVNGPNVVSGGNLITVMAADFSLASSLNSGAANTIIQMTGPGSIGLAGVGADLNTLCGGAPCAMTIDGTELAGISAQTLVVNNNLSGNIFVNGVSTGFGLELNAGGDVIFDNNPTTINSLTANSAGNTVVNTDVSTTGGNIAVAADGDSNNNGDFNLSANAQINSAGDVSISGANINNNGTINAAGSVTLNGNVQDANPANPPLTPAEQVQLQQGQNSTFVTDFLAVAQGGC
ncbi:MAG: beta strand repeat-containing protein, partial [Nitrospinaceae bacterium]